MIFLLRLWEFLNMPGHVKTGAGSKEADPDPSQFLWVSFEMKKEDSLKPYDAKKSVWVPDGEGGFDEALIDTVDGDKVNVKVGWEPKTFKSAQCMQVGYRADSNQILLSYFVR